MRDIKFLEKFHAYASCDLTTGEVFFSIPEKQKWFFNKYKRRREGFMIFLFYALQHEELHIVLYKLGIDDSVLHTPLMRRAQELAQDRDYPEPEEKLTHASYHRRKTSNTSNVTLTQ